MTMLRFLLLAMICVTSPASIAPSAAHEMSVSVLELNEIASGRFALSWQKRAQGLDVVFPGHCMVTGSILDCGATGLTGEVRITGFGDQSAAIIRIRTDGRESHVYTLTSGNRGAFVGATTGAGSPAPFGRVFQSYLGIGIEHILLGFDHLVFVLGLIWIVSGWWMLVKTVTAFTLAHSITLGAVTLGLTSVPERLVNALIALSIVFIGVEIVKKYRGETSLTIKYPWIVAFGFGLLHGFGFANALTALGIADSSLVAALLAFNVGVEISQLGFVCLVLALAWSFRTMSVALPPNARLMPAYAIGSLAAFWTFQRIAILAQSA